MTDDQMSPDVTSDDKLWAALGYVFSPLVPIIVLLMEDKKNQPYIRSHNVQALMMGILIAFVIGPVTFGCGYIAWFVMLFWAFKAYSGEEVNIPVISDFVKKQGWA